MWQPPFWPSYQDLCQSTAALK